MGRRRGTHGLEERDKTIVAAYKKGSSLRTLAYDHGLTREGVRQVLLRHGVKLRKPGKPWK